MCSFFASFAHGCSVLMGWASLYVLVVYRSHDSGLVEASLSALAISWFLTGASKRALICRTFHSSQVEAYLLERVIPALQTSCRTVLVANQIHPDKERRYSHGALVGMGCSFVSVLVVLPMSGLSFFPSLAAAIVAFLAADRWYAFRLRASSVQRRRIEDGPDAEAAILRFAAELRCPRWFFWRRYVTNLPAARIEVACANGSWFKMIVAGMYSAALTVIDLTHITDSKGLDKELELALHLIQEGHLHRRQVLLICAHFDRDAVLEHVKRRYGLSESSILIVGDPDRRDAEFTALSARAHAATCFRTTRAGQPA